MSGCHVPLSTWNGNYHPRCYCKCNTTVVVNPTPIIYQFENKKMEDKIKLLEERLNVVEQWKKVAKVLCDQSKKPHKCPVCDFSGAIQLESIEEVIRFKDEIINTDDGKNFISCRSCEGKGIVWG